MPDQLKFVVAPHIIEDFGLNLYTTLPRVLVEYVANGYDADSMFSEIIMDTPSIVGARAQMKAAWELEKARNPAAPPLSSRTLPDNLCIEINDLGHGMSRDDLKNKFLIAGRRRRVSEDSQRSEGGRPLMGRKGLGKLAGFGVARQITITTKRAGTDNATEISLDYDKILHCASTGEIPIEEQTLGGYGLDLSFTKIKLSRLIYEPLKSRESTITTHVADFFGLLHPDEFEIKFNGERMLPTQREFAYAWPNPELEPNENVECEIETEEGTVKFQYRMRFTKDRQALEAAERGVRVFAHNRLAAAPSLLSADTNMHGFRMTDYLDGVVYADFIDDQPTDYIATDRQSLRWETPLLAPVYDFLSAQIKEACKQRQAHRDSQNLSAAQTDDFTSKLIEVAGLPRMQKKAAYKMAGAVASLYKTGLAEEAYKTHVQTVISGFGKGEILTTLANLASEDHPDFERVVTEVTRLTAQELDGFLQYVKGRINGIEALKKIVMSADFRQPNNEDELHALLERCPWLIDPTYFEFLASNRQQRTVFSDLERQLQIGPHVPSTYDKTSESETVAYRKNKRPDLVFVLGNQSLEKVVIVELKAPNTPLHGEHYRQLQGYIYDAEQWLQQQGHSANVEGILIGTHADADSRADEVKWLKLEMKKTGNHAPLRVFGLSVLLDRTERAHKALLEQVVESD